VKQGSDARDKARSIGQQQHLARHIEPNPALPGGSEDTRAQTRAAAEVEEELVTRVDI
jgi:hypothetical protein